MHPGTRIGPYEVTVSIGEGGMGEVFRARDTRLNRDVAVKVLPKDFASDADRLRRFQQEAKTLAALNHPNLLTVFDAGVHDGAPYLVSELLEGKTLREEMNGGALPMRKAADYALQMAHGLAAAHNKGVIHRDLKPENIFVTKDGRVKILDFGLAKLRSPSPVGRERENDTSATSRIDADAIINTTEPGMVLGTPAYMSPEQAAAPDGRTIYYALGDSVYSLAVSGGGPTRLYAGESIAIDPQGQYLIVKDYDERSGNHLIRYSLADRTEDRLTVAEKFRLTRSPLAANAIATDGRILVQVAPLDSWFWPAAVLDPRTGQMELATEHEADMYDSGWDSEGRIVTCALFYRSSIWRFRPEK